MTGNLNKTPLDSWHRENGAKMVPFAGWEMPVQYSGIIEEHKQTRTRAALFDISHMGEFFLSGAGAAESLSRIVTHNLATLSPGKCRYGFMLNPSGGVLDDLIVYRLEKDRFMLVVNAACRDSDLEWISSNLAPGIKIEDRSMYTAKIDLQGPLSIEVLEEALPGQNWRELKYFNFWDTQWQGIPLKVSRTGYTGELGYEIYLPWERALEIWKALAASEKVKPAGLGARDTLRLEAGLLLYGQDLDTEHTPIEAGYSFMLKSEAEYIGKDALDEGKTRLVALNLPGRRAARPGSAVYYHGEKVGTVTSGSFAPSLGHCIALAYVDVQAADNTRFTIPVAKSELEARKTDLPFYKQGTARMKLS
ncbi:MAG: glycine cleavage system aminomethyltransferase GcvT [Desulfonatronovibrionaceae bacterium]